MAEGFEPFEFLDRAAVVAFSLGLVAEEQRPTVGLANHAVETVGEGVVAVLGAGDFEISGEFFGHQIDGLSGGVQGQVEAGGEEAGFEASGAEEGLLGKGDAFEGEEFLGVDGLVDVQEVGFETGDGVEVFEADDGEVGGGEAVFAGVPGGVGLAFRGAGSGGSGGVGAIGGFLFKRERFIREGVGKMTE